MKIKIKTDTETEMERIDNNEKTIKKFLDICRLISPHYKDTKIPIPTKLLQEYERRLYNYRMYLKQLGLCMPKSKYIHDRDDQNTWLYKRCWITPIKNGYTVKWELNTNCPYYDQYMRDHHML